ARESGHAGLPAAVAQVLSVGVPEVEALFAQASNPEEADAAPTTTPSAPALTVPPVRATPNPPPAAAEEGLTLQQLFDAIVRARRGDHALGGQLFTAMQQLAVNTGQPAELRALGRVLVRILVGDSKPDLAGLPEDLTQAVQALLAELRTAAG
ncbi:MAG: hypothetical protein WAV79_02330, partial [Anaerolineae bacterium]